MSGALDRQLAEAILGLDTLWGGDVMCPSGTGRFIADSWFSDEPLPASHTHPAADAVRRAGGLSATEPDRAGLDAYLRAVDLHGAIDGVVELGEREGGPRGLYLAGLGQCLEVMWELAMEALDRGEPVTYARSVEACCGVPPSPSEPAGTRGRLAAELAAIGYPADAEADLLAAVDAWRRDRLTPRAAFATLARAFIAELEAGTAAHVLPHLPAELHAVPRSNVELQLIPDAVFSGSMNYVGRARDAEGRPLYEATYELNASLEISIPELLELVAHEVVPGHVTTFALLQHLFVLGRVGFEASVQTMSTRGSTLSEGIANNAALMAHGVTELADLPDPDLRVAQLLSALQDDAKNQASWLTWQERWPQPEVAAVLRRDCLVSAERAEKLSGPWARHPIMGRMYLPSYRAGTEAVARLRRQHPPERVLPALYGCRGLVDVTTVETVL